jgi:hypothetical protein
MRWPVTGHERLLAHGVEQRLAMIDGRLPAGGDDEELAGGGCFRPPEHRRRDIALPRLVVRFGQAIR